MNSAINDEGAALFGKAADCIAAQGIPGMNSNADDIAGLHTVHIQLSHRLVPNDWVAEITRGGRGQNKKPSWCYDRSTEGSIAGVDEMNFHEIRRWAARRPSKPSLIVFDYSGSHRLGATQRHTPRDCIEKRCSSRVLQSASSSARHAAGCNSRCGHVRMIASI